jgi:hypothetical protein
MAQESEHAGTADQAAEQMLKQVANLTPWGIMQHARRHIAAAFTFTQKLSQAADLQDRVRIHAEHAKMHIDLFNELAKELSDAMAVASNLVGAVVSQLHVHKHQSDMERKSATRKSSGGAGQTPSSNPGPSPETR